MTTDPYSLRRDQIQQLCRWQPWQGLHQDQRCRLSCRLRRTTTVGHIAAHTGVRYGNRTTIFVVRDRSKRGLTSLNSSTIPKGEVRELLFIHSTSTRAGSNGAPTGSQPQPPLASLSAEQRLLPKWHGALRCRWRRWRGMYRLGEAQELRTAAPLLPTQEARLRYSMNSLTNPLERGVWYANAQPMRYWPTTREILLIRGSKSESG